MDALRTVLSQRTARVDDGRRRDKRSAAVLVPFFIRDGELRLLMFLRSERVPSHRGQVAFPGGSRDPGDQGMQQTALREAQEEMGIEPDRVVMLGALTPFDTRVNDFSVSPFCGFIADPDPVFAAETFEVEKVLEIPVDRLRDPATRHWGLVPGFSLPVPLTYYDVGDGIIWGVSGSIVGELLDLLDQAGGLIAA